MIQPRIADMYYGNAVNFSQVSTWAWGCIHKVSQGPGFHDPKWRQRRDIMRGLGVMVMAYDFSTDDNVAKNVADFITVSDLTANETGCLDFEDNRFHNMSGDQAHEWCDRYLQATGKRPWLYGGNHITDYVGRHPRIDPQDPKWVDMAKVVPLWRCRYLNMSVPDNVTLFRVIKPIPPWTDMVAIQYAADGSGPQPHQQSGVENGADLSATLCTKEQLALAFAGKPGWDQPVLPAVA